MAEEHGKAYEKAKEYYPELWNMGRIITLYKAGLLTRADFIDITGEEPPEI